MSEIFKKIPVIMSEIGAIGKDRKNQQQGYSFRGIDDVYAAVNSVLAKHGVFCVPTILKMVREERQTQKGGTLLYTILDIQYRFYASDGSYFDCVTVGEAMDSGDKSCNKAMSAAQKYAFFQVFSIPTEEPKDTEHESHTVMPKKSAQVADKQGAAASSPPSPAPPTDKPNYKFLEVMKGQKERVGEDYYYKTIGLLGYEKANEIHDRNHQKELYEMLLVIPDKEKE